MEWRNFQIFLLFLNVCVWRLIFVANENLRLKMSPVTVLPGFLTACLSPDAINQHEHGKGGRIYGGGFINVKTHISHCAPRPSALTPWFSVQRPLTGLALVSSFHFVLFTWHMPGISQQYYISSPIVWSLWSLGKILGKYFGGLILILLTQNIHMFLRLKNNQSSLLEGLQSHNIRGGLLSTTPHTKKGKLS